MLPSAANEYCSTRYIEICGWRRFVQNDEQFPNIAEVEIGIRRSYVTYSCGVVDRPVRALAAHFGSGVPSRRTGCFVAPVSAADDR